MDFNRSQNKVDIKSAFEDLDRQFGQETAGQIISTYIAESKQRRQLLAGNDFATIQRLTHSLKGDAPLVGAHFVARLAATAHDQCRSSGSLDLELMNELTQAMLESEQDLAHVIEKPA